jgi:hypothetical protein
MPARPAWVREVNGMRLCKGTTEGPRRVRQLDGAFLFGHERIVANPDITPVLGYFRLGGDSTETLDRTFPFLDKRIGDTLGLFFGYGNIRPIFSLSAELIRTASLPVFGSGNW